MTRGVARHATGWGRTPSKGTLLRRMLKLLLRPEGATSFELVEAGLRKTITNTYISLLRDQKGWDIRAFPCPEHRYQSLTGTRKTRTAYVFKIVGRMRWDGTYRSLISKEQLDGLTDPLPPQN